MSKVNVTISKIVEINIVKYDTLKELVEKKMNGHIREDIESNLMSGKETFWKQIKKITFTPGNEEKPNGISRDSEDDKLH